MFCDLKKGEKHCVRACLIRHWFVKMAYQVADHVWDLGANFQLFSVTDLKYLLKYNYETLKNSKLNK